MSLGAALLYLAVKLFYETNKPARLAMACAALLLACVVIGHGLFYVCLGVWGLPNLYDLARCGGSLLTQPGNYKSRHPNIVGVGMPGY